MTDFKQQINDHLQAYGKTESIDSHWIDLFLFTIEQIHKMEKKIDEFGMTQTSEKNGYIVKNGYAQAHEALVKSFVGISIKLGLSPHDRDKWIKQTKFKNDGGLIK